MYGRLQPFYSGTVVRQGEEGRPFAMMAAQRLDVLVNRSSFSLIFFVIAASGAKNGMPAVEICFGDVSYG